MVWVVTPSSSWAVSRLSSNLKIGTNMKKIFYTIALSAAVAVVASCNLDLVPNSAIAYNPEQIVESESDLNGFENGMFAYYRGSLYGVYSIASEVMCDGFNAMVDFGNNYGSIHRTDASFSATDYDAEDHWEGLYHAIMRYNVVINGLQTNVPADLAEKAAVVRGEGYFFRADAYLRLVRLYGKAYGNGTPASDLGVPLVLEYDQTARPARNTVQEVYDQIKVDLDSAATLLANVKGAVRAQKPTIDAVNALYARYYLDTKNYANAATYAQRVIDSAAGYALSSTAEEMTAEWYNDNGKEPVIQLYATYAERPNRNYDAFTNTARDPEWGDYFRPYFLPSSNLMNLYEDGDLRLAQWFDKGAHYVFYNSDYHTGEFYVFTKYLGNPALRANPTAMPDGYQAVKPILISEMYLIAAEANLGAGNAAAAKAALNTLQTKRGATATDATASAIHNEWFKETVGEGTRMVCLKRWNEGFSSRPGQAGAVAGGALAQGPAYEAKSLPAGDFHYLWPIPSHEFEVNSNLVQNPGYSAAE